jgi:hypothetical protein
VEQVGGFIDLPAVGFGSEKGGIRLQEEAFDGHAPGDLLLHPGLGEGHRPRHGEVATPGQTTFSSSPIPGKAMEHHTGEPVGMDGDDVQGVFVSVTHVDDDGETQLTGELQLLLEAAPLDRAWLAVAIVVEAYLTNGHHLRTARQGLQIVS